MIQESARCSASTHHAAWRNNTRNAQLEHNLRGHRYPALPNDVLLQMRRKQRIIHIRCAQHHTLPTAEYTSDEESTGRWGCDMFGAIPTLACTHTHTHTHIARRHVCHGLCVTIATMGPRLIWVRCSQQKNCLCTTNTLNSAEQNKHRCALRFDGHHRSESHRLTSAGTAPSCNSSLHPGSQPAQKQVVEYRVKYIARCATHHICVRTRVHARARAHTHTHTVEHTCKLHTDTYTHTHTHTKRLIAKASYPPLNAPSCPHHHYGGKIPIPI